MNVNLTKNTAHAQKGKKKLLDRVRDEIRFRHYSIRTEQAYVDWIRRFILFHDKRHPSTMGAVEIKQFLEHLALQRRVAANTQNQAFNALLFLYREILHQDFALGEVQRAKQKVSVQFEKVSVQFV